MSELVKPKFNGVIFGYIIDTNISLGRLITERGYSAPSSTKGATKRYTSPKNPDYYADVTVSRPYSHQMFIQMHFAVAVDLMGVMEDVFDDFERIGIDLYGHR